MNPVLVTARPYGVTFSSEEMAKFEALPTRAKTSWYIESALVAMSALVIWAVVFGSPILDVDGVAWEALSLLGIAVLWFVELFVLIPARFRHSRIAILHSELVSVRGALIRRVRIQPWRHVLYVEVRQGPLLSRLDLYRVRIGTISDVHIEGPMTLESVEALRVAARTAAQQ